MLPFVFTPSIGLPPLLRRNSGSLLMRTHVLSSEVLALKGLIYPTLETRC
jgi:hypothetical protein